jgi:hypothetical protein
MNVDKAKPKAKPFNADQRKIKVKMKTDKPG